MSALLNLIVVCFSLEMEAQLRTKWHQWKLLRCMVLNSRILSVAQNMSYMSHSVSMQAIYVGNAKQSRDNTYLFQGNNYI